MSKLYSRPSLELNFFETTDVIATSSGEALNDIIKDVSASSSRTQTYDFSDLFGA